MTFGATWFTHLLRRARLLAPSTDLTTFAANGGFYFQAFNGSVALPVAGYDHPNALRGETKIFRGPRPHAFISFPQALHALNPIASLPSMCD